MKGIFAAAAIVSFVGIAVFGVFAMHLGMSHTTQCLASLISSNANCPNATNILKDIVFHTNAFKTFSTAIFLLATFGSFITVLLAFLSVRFCLFAPASLAHNKKSSALFSLLAFRKFSRWFALKEHSPTSL